MRFMTKGAAAALAAATMVAGAAAATGAAAEAYPVRGVQTGDATTGDLVGTFAGLTITSVTPHGGGNFALTATETYIGCIDVDGSGACDAGSPAGTMDFVARITGRVDPASPSGFARIGGAERAVSGTGDFEGARGKLVFREDVVTGEIPFHGVIKLR